MLISLSIAEAQAPIANYGIKQYGNTFDQPFHSSSSIRQDSTGRILFDQGNQIYRFDGKTFTRIGENVFGELVLIDSDARKWYHNRDETIFRCAVKDTLSINVKDYFESGMTYMHESNDTVRIMSHKGVASFLSDATRIEHIETQRFDKFVPYSAVLISDTFFVKALPKSRYVIKNDFTKAEEYGEVKANGYPNNNGLFKLPHNRILYVSIEEEVLLSENDAYFEFIDQFNFFDIRRVKIDSKGMLWVLSEDPKRRGVFIFDPILKQTKHFPLDAEIIGNAHSMFEDENGGMWIGTSGAGLIHVFEKSIHVLDEAAGLGDNNIWSTAQGEDGTVYLATRCSGIETLKPDGQIETYTNGGCAWAILPDKNNIWISDEGMKLLNDARLERYVSKKDGLLSRRIYALYRDSQSDIWIGTRKAIHLYKNGRIEKYEIPSVEIYDCVFNIEEYELGKLILVLQSGRVFAFENESFTEITFTDEKVTRILKDQEGRIWLSTNGSGLFAFQNNEFIKIKYAPEAILQMQDDDRGDLWGITSDNKMFYAEKNALLSNDSAIAIHYLTADHGLPLISQNYDAQPTTTLLRDGRILFPNIHGAILIDPQGVKKDHPEFDIELNNGGKVGRKFALGYGENDVRMQLFGVNLHPERPIEFQYKYDAEWQDIPASSNEISLNNLKKGLHEILIRGRYVNQAWFEPKTVSLEVQPLFYEKWWVQLLAILLVSAIIYGFVKWRTGIVKRQNEFLSQKVQEQTKVIENEKEQLARSLEQQQQLTKELSLSQKTKNRLYAQIAHEFKSPLQAMSTYLSKSHVALTPADQGRITKNINRLLDTSKEILELSKSDSGDLVARKNYYNINSIISDQLELMDALIKEKNLAIAFKQINEKAFLFLDISLFQKVVTNLLSNAIKFSQSYGKIEIVSEVRNSKQYIGIEDNGPGIPEDEVDSLVLPYFQASNNTEDGSGIGLSFVDRILKLHDSKLDIKTALGLGSTFSFTLPRPELSQAEIVNRFVDESDINLQLASFVNQNKPLVLVVDDNDDVLHFYRQTLSSKYRVMTSVNGQVALSAIELVKPDIIISDVHMPIMGGVEFLKAVRQQAQMKAVPFFFVSGSTSEEMEIQSLKSGVDVVLKKPIQEEYLHSRIERAISSKADLVDLVKTSFSHDLLPPDIQQDDLMLIQQMETVILKNIGNSKLKSSDIANDLGIGERTLRNRVKAISSLTVKEYLKNYRLEKAKLLIEQSQRTKAEIAHAVGFSSQSYFSKSYKAYFNK